MNLKIQRLKVARHLSFLLCSLFLFPAPAQSAFKGAMVHNEKGNIQAVPDSYAKTQWTKIRFPIIAYDTDHLWDAKNQQFVVPDGVSFVRLSGQIVWSHDSFGARQVLITKNNKLFDGYAAQNGNAIIGTTPDQNVSTAILKVEPGDTFQLQAWHIQSDKNVPTSIYDNGGTWFSIEVIE